LGVQRVPQTSFDAIQTVHITQLLQWVCRTRIGVHLEEFTVVLLLASFPVVCYLFSLLLVVMVVVVVVEG
jgi:hypothetical protein